MKAAFLTGLRQMEIRETDAPSIGRDDEVLLRVEVVGVCGSDVHTYKTGQIGGQAVKYPWTVGHECAATVAETGSAVANLPLGQRVVVDPLLVCGECDQCLSGRRHTCRNQRFLASPGQAPGALAEYLVMPAECCFPIPDAMSFDQAVMVEPFSIGLYAQRMANMPPGGSATILGCGPIGLSVLLALKAAGATRTYCTDLLGERLALAEWLGADWTGDPDAQDVVAEITALAPEGVDRVFECAGEQETVDQAVALLKPGGMLVMIGIPEVDRISLPIHIMRRREITFQNVRRQNECIGPAIEMIAAGAVDVDPLMTHHFDLAHSRDAFELVADYRDGVVKAMVNVGATAGL